MNYDDKRFERFYSHYCANLVQKNDVKHRKDGHDLITMNQWIGALENKEDEEHYIKAWCYFIGKPFLYDKINFFEEFVKFCNEIDTGSTSLELHRFTIRPPLVSLTPTLMFYNKYL